MNTTHSVLTPPASLPRFPSVVSQAEARYRSGLVERQFRPQPTTATKCVMTLVAAVGLALTSYLSWVSFTSSEIAGCGGGSVIDCNQVMHTRWATILGVPVSVPAVFVYLSVLTGLCLTFFVRRGRLRELGLGIVVLGALSAAAGALWFVGLQLLVVGHLCSYCLAAHACGLTLAGIVLWKAPLSRRRMSQLALLSVCGVFALATLQMRSEPPSTFTVEHHAAPANRIDQPPAASGSKVFTAPGFAPPKTSDSVSSDAGESSATGLLASRGGAEHSADTISAARSLGWIASMSSAIPIKPQLSAALNLFVFQTSDSAPPVDTTNQGEQTEKTSPRRLVSIAGGKIQLDAKQWPLIGDPNAQLIFVEMFDYTCPHCRANHQFLQSAVEHFDDSIAIMALSVPLSSQCNDTVTREDATHASACELSRLSVAVWRVEPKKFPAFHNWLFSGSSAPSVAAAMKQAEALVGRSALHAELQQGVAGQYVAKQVELYKSIGAGNVPKLLFPGTSVTGTAASAASLINIIEQQLKAEL